MGHRRARGIVVAAGIAAIATGCWTNRGVPPGTVTASAVGVNEAGTILVQAAPTADGGGLQSQGWVLSADDEWSPLGAIDPDDAIEPVGINDDGTVVGNSVDYGASPPIETPFIWTVDSGIEPLSDVLGEAHDKVTGISDAGHIVGFDSAPFTEPWIWIPESAASISLSPLPGYAAALAEGVNEQGWVIGQSVWGPENSTPTVWAPPSYSPVGLPIEDADSALVTDIDADGTMVGNLWYDDGERRSRAVVWDEASGHALRYLDEDPDPDKFQFANVAVAIDDGVVIGEEEGCTPETPVCGGIWWEVAWNAETLERVELYGNGISNEHPWFSDLDGPHLVGTYHTPDFAQQIASRTTPEV